MQLHRGDVLEGALALLDAEGLDGLTTRKLAARLGVQAGALYWHFANKQALLDAMAERLFEGVGDPLPPGSWDEQLTVLAGRLHRALLSRRDGARLAAGTYVAEHNTLLAGKAFMTVLQAAGLAPERAAWATFALGNYVLGHTIEEQDQAALVASGAWAAKLGEMREQDPDYARVAGPGFDADPAQRFAYGLEIFLDGIRHQLPAPTTTATRRRPTTRSGKASSGRPPSGSPQHTQPGQTRSQAT